MTEQERLELQLEQDAKSVIEALERIKRSTDAYNLKFGAPTAGTRTDKITWSATHMSNFLENNGNAQAGDHRNNLLTGMYVV